MCSGKVRDWRTNLEIPYKHSPALPHCKNTWVLLCINIEMTGNWVEKPSFTFIPSTSLSFHLKSLPKASKIL